MKMLNPSTVNHFTGQQSRTGDADPEALSIFGAFGFYVRVETNGTFRPTRH